MRGIAKGHIVRASPVQNLDAERAAAHRQLVLETSAIHLVRTQRQSYEASVQPFAVPRVQHAELLTVAEIRSGAHEEPQAELGQLMPIQVIREANHVAQIIRSDLGERLAHGGRALGDGPRALLDYRDLETGAPADEVDGERQTRKTSSEDSHVRAMLHSLLRPLLDIRGRREKVALGDDVGV
jgi:hypothetical protein